MTGAFMRLNAYMYAICFRENHPLIVFLSIRGEYFFSIYVKLIFKDVLHPVTYICFLEGAIKTLQLYF